MTPYQGHDPTYTPEDPECPTLQEDVGALALIDNQQLMALRDRLVELAGDARFLVTQVPRDVWLRERLDGLATDLEELGRRHDRLLLQGVLRYKGKGR